MAFTSAQHALADTEENPTPQRAKRIARPAHWKRQAAAPSPKVEAAIAAPIPDAEAVLQPAPKPAAKTQVVADAWRTSPHFIMRTLACVCVLNFLLFTVFPENPLNIAMTDETIVAPSARNILPSNQRAGTPTTLYAPAPRPKSVARTAPTDSLRTPRWLRGPANE